MAKNRRSFTAQQKLAIINEADQQGIAQTLRMHNLAYSVFNRWKESFYKGGAASLKATPGRRIRLWMRLRNRSGCYKCSGETWAGTGVQERAFKTKPTPRAEAVQVKA